MQTIDAQFTTPAGNTYAIHLPVENLKSVLPVDFLGTNTPVPEYVSADDADAYRVCMAATIFIVQQELFARRIAAGWSPRMPTCKEEKILEAARLHTDMNTSLSEFATGIASHWRALRHFIEIGAEECSEITATGATPIYPVGPFGQTAVEIGAEAAAAYGAEYVGLRNSGYSAQQIAEAIAKALSVELFNGSHHPYSGTFNSISNI